MKTIEDMAHEYAEALNDIADLLEMPTGSTSAQIVKMAGNRWARGMHTCHAQCSRSMCVLRRERNELREKYATHHAEADRLTLEISAAKCTLAKWIEWARMHGHLDHAAGIADDSRRLISSENVKEHATPLAGASVETGGEG